MSIWAELRAGVRCADAAATAALGARLAAALPPNTVLALEGPVGAGKTTFVRGLAAGLGIAGVSSPSYALVHWHCGRYQLAHADAYRLARPEDFAALLIEELLEEPWCLAVEWPGQAGGFLPPGARRLVFESLPDGARLVRLAE